MSGSTTFLNDLNSSMERLARGNTMVKKNLENRAAFSNNLITKLKEISQRIKDLAGRIVTLRSDVDKLQAEINGHTKSIGDNNAQINDLQAQIQKLEKEKLDAVKQFNDLQAQAATDRQALQQQIDEKEANLRAVTGERDTLKERVDALHAGLSARGDTDQQHAEAIANLTQQHQQQLAAKDGGLAAREAELTNQINDKEAQIQLLNNTVLQKQGEVDNHVRNLATSEQLARDQIRDLMTRNGALKDENDNLKDRIVAASLAINEAADNLDALMNAEPNAANQDEITNTFNEIEASLQAISSSLQGRGGPSSSASSSSSSSSSSKPMLLALNTDINYKGQTRKLSVIIWYLEQKIRQIGPRDPDNKYALALGLIKAATTVEEVDAILQKNNIEWTGDGSRFKGGLRTRKGKKMIKTKKNYKGGFVYKANKKRRSISSSSKMSASSRKRSFPSTH